MSLHTFTFSKSIQYNSLAGEIFSSKFASINSWRTDSREEPTWGAKKQKNLRVLHSLQEVTQFRDGATFLTQQFQ